MTYLLDNNISFRFAGMLRALDVDIYALREKFPQNIPDAELLAAMKESDDVFLTADRRIKTRPIEAKLLREARVTALFLAPFWEKLTQCKQAAWLVGHWETIHGFVSGVARGTCADLQQSGRSRIFHH